MLGHLGSVNQLFNKLIFFPKSRIPAISATTLDKNLNHHCPRSLPRHQEFHITFFQSFVLEIVGTNVSTTYVTCPADPRKTLGIKVARFE